MASGSLSATPQCEIPANYVNVGGLHVHPTLYKTVEEKICPDTGFSAGYFWSCLSSIVAELRPEVERCLAKRDELQQKIDAWYAEKKESGADLSKPDYRPSCRDFLRDIGYLVPDKGPVSVTTQFVDEEIAKVPAPQLVVPSDNARYVLNAVNARWGSLYDALYGFDVIPAYSVTSSGVEINAAKGSSGYNPMRGEAVIDFANGLLDEIAPLVHGKWGDVCRLWPKFVGSVQRLELLLKDGTTTALRTPSLFVGSQGNLGPPDADVARPQPSSPCVPDQGRIFLKHNGLHMILEIDRTHPIGKAALSGIKDITTESALTAILDMEDSVSAVDAEDKCKIYSNICGIFRGALEAPFVKDGKALTRKMNYDVWFRDAKGNVCTIPGRALALVRNVGHHMFTDAVLTSDGKFVPEGFLDCLVTTASALHDLRGTSRLMNSREGSVYIVKPKQHGPDEIALTSRLFGRAEEFFGLRRNTIKMGIMDEERRTSANLRECLRAAMERVFFINTGFLDRTGDEIHTCMFAGPVVRKGDMKKQNWIQSYEAGNVDVGLHSNLQGRAQIGKGMWAKPDSMKDMLQGKISELMAGASTAWVPSPAAATLHSIHYHHVDVPERQMQLAMRPAAKIEMLLEPPLLPAKLSKEEIAHELKENAQSILGYVVRWIDLGIGCSKVPDLSNVGLMEDRATLRISSQLLANWLQHDLVSEDQVRDVFLDMAKLVDQQNAREPGYIPMSLNPEHSPAFQAAMKLVLEGRKAPNGYTEYTLHEARRSVKEQFGGRSRL
ncbi:glcB [Symbiodinium sp. CCMP2592]|nr:glcB [Symbiodinium sp. CCMP2592]